MVARTRGVELAAAALLVCSSPVVAGQAFDSCFEQQAERFGLDPELLRSIAVVESGMRPHVDNNSQLAHTGTSDIGLMQINSSWVPVLTRYGITRADLRDPCTSIEVGAWILSDLIRRNGDTWEALGAYNAACTQLKGRACQKVRSAYAWRVWRARQREADSASTLAGAGDSRKSAAAVRADARSTGLIAASNVGAATRWQATP